uniref:Hypothetical conserved protein n=1 Tax=uncultured Planctomycetota bacterium TaxID=120965 RepID=H5SII2_9BACT|nr:hypothetical conserved protein [uncultured Planctomycetota bacterium]
MMGQRMLRRPAQWRLAARAWDSIAAGIVVLLGVFVSGCRLPTLLYFTAAMLGKDMRQPPAIDLLTYRDKLKKPRHEPLRVAIVCYADVGTQIHLGPFARELDDALARELAKGFSDQKDRLLIVAPSAVHRWQERQENWAALEPSEMARELGADVVIFVELNRLSLYEGGSNRTLYRGRAEVQVTVAAAQRPASEDVYNDLVERTQLDVQYPRNHAPLAADVDISPDRFRRQFVRYLAEVLSWLFLPHDSKDELTRDPI